MFWMHEIIFLKMFTLHMRLNLLKTNIIVYGGNTPDPVLNLILLFLPPLVMFYVVRHAISAKIFSIELLIMPKVIPNHFGAMLKEG